MLLLGLYNVPVKMLHSNGYNANDEVWWACSVIIKGGDERMSQSGQIRYILSHTHLSFKHFTDNYDGLGLNSRYEVVINYF